MFPKVPERYEPGGWAARERFVPLAPVGVGIEGGEFGSLGLGGFRLLIRVAPDAAREAIVAAWAKPAGAAAAAVPAVAELPRNPPPSTSVSEAAALGAAVAAAPPLMNEPAVEAAVPMADPAAEAPADRAEPAAAIRGGMKPISSPSLHI